MIGTWVGKLHALSSGYGWADIPPTDASSTTRVLELVHRCGAPAEDWRKAALRLLEAWHDGRPEGDADADPVGAHDFGGDASMIVDARTTGAALAHPAPTQQPADNLRGTEPSVIDIALVAENAAALELAGTLSLLCARD